MLETINQPIAVQTLFNHGQIKPLNFCWNQVCFKIDKIIFTHQSRSGQTVLYFFTVICQQLVYQLQFNQQTFVWKLFQIYDDPSC